MVSCWSMLCDTRWIHFVGIVCVVVSWWLSMPIQAQHMAL
jgi:hypothetical protein